MPLPVIPPSCRCGALLRPDVVPRTDERVAVREAARRLGVEPRFCRGYEDVDLGVRAVRDAGMEVVDVREMLCGLGT